MTFARMSLTAQRAIKRRFHVDMCKIGVQLECKDFAPTKAEWPRSSFSSQYANSAANSSSSFPSMMMTRARARAHSEFGVLLLLHVSHAQSRNPISTAVKTIGVFSPACSVRSGRRRRLLLTPQGGNDRRKTTKPLLPLPLFRHRSFLFPTQTVAKKKKKKRNVLRGCLTNPRSLTGNVFIESQLERTQNKHPQPMLLAYDNEKRCSHAESRQLHHIPQLVECVCVW